LVGFTLWALWAYPVADVFGEHLDERDTEWQTLIQREHRVDAVGASWTATASLGMGNYSGSVSRLQFGKGSKIY